MTKVYLIRHSESVANTLGIYQGQTYDTGLSELGKKQAQALAQKLKDKKIEKIYSSPLKRTEQTAKTVEKELGLKTVFDLNLIETNHGEWEGLSKEEIKLKYNGKYEAWLETPVTAFFPGGESFSETVARAEAFLTSTIFDEDSVVITHDNIIRAMLSIIEYKEINKMWEYELDPAGITEIEVDYMDKDNFFKVVKINHVGHLKNLRADLTVHAL